MSLNVREELKFTSRKSSELKMFVYSIILNKATLPQFGVAVTYY